MRFREPITVLIIWSNIQCSVEIWRTVQCKNIHSVYHHTVCNMRQLVDIHVIITLHSTSYFCTVHTVHCEAVGGLFNMNYRMHCVVIWSRVCIVYCHIAHCAIWEYTVCNVRQLVDSQWLEEQSPATMECPTNVTLVYLRWWQWQWQYRWWDTMLMVLLQTILCRTALIMVYCDSLLQCWTGGDRFGHKDLLLRFSTHSTHTNLLETSE